MSKLYFFHCTRCQEEWVLAEDQSGWLDQTGKIGYTLTIDQQPDGNYTGNWYYITLFDALCLECNIVYGIVIRDSVRNYYSKINQHSYDYPILLAPKITITNGSVNGHQVFTFQNTCNKCNGGLLTASQLVEKSRLKKESRLLGLKPNDTKKNVVLCPNCHKSELEFYQVMRYHK